MSTALQGKDVVLLWRKLSDQTLLDAKLMMFQTEHEVSLGRDSDNTTTKFGILVKPGELEDEVSFTTLVDVENKVSDYLEEAMRNGDEMECWEVDITKLRNGETSESGKYPAWYRQGNLTEYSTTHAAEDYSEVSGTFMTNMKAQKGEATFTDAQMEAIQYAFEDTLKKSEETPGV